MMATSYITKYAVGGKGGLTTVEDPKISAWNDGSQWVRSSDGWTSFKIGREAFDSRDDAVADAESRRAKKIASLKKQIAKLEKLTF